MYAANYTFAFVPRICRRSQAHTANRTLLTGTTPSI